MRSEPPTLIIDRRHSRSLRSRVVTAALQRATTPYLRKLTSSELTPEVLTRLSKFDELAARGPVPKGTRTEPVMVGDVAAEWVHGARVGATRYGVILYLHGGGWLFGGLNSHRALTSRISSASGAPVLALDYRMVPKVPFDQEIEDCVAGFRWLLDRGIHPERIAIMGDSAGGYLTLATALRARSYGLPMPAALVGISGVYDMDSASKAAHANAKVDAAGSLAALDWMTEVVLGGLDPADPKVSPLRADLAGLPPTLLTASSSEIIYCDSEDLARALVAAGVPCTLQVWNGQLHVFQALGPLIPEAKLAIADIGTFVRAALDKDFKV
jgi:acetyl esterase/lipase